MSVVRHRSEISCFSSETDFFVAAGMVARRRSYLIVVDGAGRMQGEVLGASAELSVAL